jgi:protein TonB
MARTPPTRFADAPILSARARLGMRGAIVVGYGALVLCLIHAFDPLGRYTTAEYRPPPITSVVLVPPAAPSGPQSHHHRAEGASGVAARRAAADQIAAPSRMAVIAPPAAPVAGTGSTMQSGASAGGEGTGGAGSGNGPGSGGAGDGRGGAVVAPTKIAGDLAERDYAKAGRAKRLGTAVIVALTVGTDGRVTACRVHQPSGDPDADAVTCRLAIERFRFRPALDRNGHPVEGLFGWQQRFFAP